MSTSPAASTEIVSSKARRNASRPGTPSSELVPPPKSVPMTPLATFTLRTLPYCASRIRSSLVPRNASAVAKTFACDACPPSPLSAGAGNVVAPFAIR